MCFSFYNCLRIHAFCVFFSGNSFRPHKFLRHQWMVSNSSKSFSCVFFLCISSGIPLEISCVIPPEEEGPEGPVEVVFGNWTGLSFSKILKMLLFFFLFLRNSLWDSIRLFYRNSSKLKTKVFFLVFVAFLLLILDALFLCIFPRFQINQGATKWVIEGSLLYIPERISQEIPVGIPRRILWRPT